MPQTPIEKLLAPFPLIKEWFATVHENPRWPSRTKAAALMMFHHGRQKGASVYSLDEIAKAVGYTAASLSVRKKEPKFIGEMQEEAYHFGAWALSDRAYNHRLRDYAGELKRIVDHLAPYAAEQVYEAVCLNYDDLVEQYREDGHAADVPVLLEVAAHCASRGFSGVPMSEVLIDAVAAVVAKPEIERLCHGNELRAALREQAQSTAALRAEVRALQAEVARLKQLIGEGNAR